MRSTLLSYSILLLCFAWIPSTTSAEEESSSQSATYRTMSFNLRYGTANDGDNRWPNRKELVATTIKRFDPDLLGMQEAMPLQIKYLQDQLPGYQYVGKSRVPNNPKEEQCAIFYRKDRFEELEQGHFWLSETPRVPASKSWDSSLPRMATWVRLFDRENRRSIFLLNTHFDHIGRKAREESAIIIREQIARQADGPTIVTGDFNAAENSKPHQILVADAAPVKLVDTFRQAHPEQTSDVSTISGFRGRRSGRRIDWVLASTDFTILEAAIDRYHEGDRYPSDHYPVTAILSLPAE